MVLVGMRLCLPIICLICNVKTKIKHAIFYGKRDILKNENFNARKIIAWDLLERTHVWILSLKTGKFEHFTIFIVLKFESQYFKVQIFTFLYELHNFSRKIDENEMLVLVLVTYLQ